MIEDTKCIYVDGYAHWDDMSNNSRVDKVLKICTEIDNCNIDNMLDIGCGDGRLTTEIARRLSCKDVSGIDISNNAVEIAKRNDVNALILDIDKHDLSFKSNSFDFIYCGNMIEIICNADHLLSEIHRVLKKDGCLLICYPNLAAWASRLAILLGYQPFYDRISNEYNLGKIMQASTKGKSTGYIRLLTTRTFKIFVGLYGFEIDKIWGAREDSIPNIMSLFDSVLSKIPSLAFQNIVLANKREKINE